MNGLISITPPRLVDKLMSWFVVVMLCTLMGNGFGQLIDVLLWEISYDYVHPADYVRANGIRLGGWLGTCVAAATVLGSRPLPHFGWTLKASVVAVLLVCMIALVFAVAGWGAVKVGFHNGGTVSLSRAAFCAELVRGGLAGAFIAAALWMVAVWRHRRVLVIHDRSVSLQPMNVQTP